MEAADREIVKCQKYARRGLIKFVGEDVANPLATALDFAVNVQEAPLKDTVNMGLGLADLSPHWLLFDRQGLADTYTSLGESIWKGSLFNAPLHPQEFAQAKLQELKGLVHAEDWGSDRPGLGAAETAFDVGTIVAPVVGEFGGVRAIGRGVEPEADATGAAGGKSGEAVGGVGGTRGALGGITKAGEDLTKNLENSTKDLPKIQPHSAHKLKTNSGQGLLIGNTSPAQSPPARNTGCVRLDRRQLLLAPVQQIRRPEHPFDLHLDDHPPRVGARGAVALRVAQLGVTHGVPVAVDLRSALQRQPPGAVDLTQHRHPATVGVDGLLRPAGGDDPCDVGLGVERETHGHHVR